MKTVYFVQHGVALSDNIDEKRPLSSIGIAEVKRVAHYLKNRGVIIDKIYHSGKLRALQTAEIFSKIVEISSIQEHSGMNPNDSADAFIETITEDSVMYIGHLPHLETAVSTILCNGTNNRVVKFQNSAVLCLEIYKSVGSVKWYITPDIC